MDNQKYYRLTKTQEEFLAFETGGYEPSAINHIGVLFAPNHIYTDCMIKKALNYLIKQEQALRMRIAVQDGCYFQYECEYREREFPIWSFENQSHEEILEICKKHLQSKGTQIDCDLFDAAIVHEKDKVCVFLMMHHLFTDGWSTCLVVSGMLNLLKLIEQDCDIRVEEHKYTNFLPELDRIILSRHQIDREYWSQKYSIDHFLPMPANLREQSSAMRAGRISTKLSDADSKALLAFCRENKLKADTVFLTALVLYLFSQNTMAKRIDVGQMLHNRYTNADRKTVGLYTGELVLCVEIDSLFRADELLYCTKLAQLETLHHPSILHDEILSIAKLQNPEIKAIRTAEFNFIPNLLCGYDVDVEWIDNDSVDTDIAMNIHNFYGDEAFLIYFDYKTDALSKHDAKKALDSIMFYLRCYINSPNNRKQIGEIIHECAEYHQGIAQ